MARPDFGLNDAPSLWHLRIDELMKQMGTYALVSNPQLYARWRSASGVFYLDALDLVCTKHGMIVKGAASQTTFDDQCRKLTAELGEDTIQTKNC